MLDDEKPYQLLHDELAADDPWRLDSNPFERERHRQMLRLAVAQETIENGLEVGCAAGAFTEMLAPHCQKLTVVDVVPHALDRTRHRLKDPPNISWITCDILRFSTREVFDLIVVAEVLYYLNSVSDMRAAVRNLAKMLAPSGHLIFGSAGDANCRRWGHVAGAETVMTILDQELVQVDRLRCVGRSNNEDCLLTRYRHPVSR
ncbi:MULTISPECIES: nodulation methyltransferase NodS [Microvirga]|uniref:nodulation methyltransferase NodS n=1 Tax=Microvirga TaxID=186650 RepID=UPI0013B45915|nr:MULTISPECIES: nodulation methyltransferase NodS [Microvirga]MBQ0819360.1 methyltransferase domain-containing protein [Microvirga sp. HBU67558]